MKNVQSPPSSVVADQTEVQATAKVSATLDKFIEERLDVKISKALNKVLTYIVTVFLAVVVVKMYDLSEKTSETIGAQAMRKEISDTEIRKLHEDIQDLKQQISYYECINDSRVKNKGDCYKK